VNLGRRRSEVGRNEHLDHQKPRRIRHRFATSLEDPRRSAVVPVVQDEGEEIEVAARRNRPEEIARDHPTSAPEAVGGQTSLRRRGDDGQVEHDPGDGRMRVEDVPHQQSWAATDVDDSSGARKIQGAKDRSSQNAPVVRHDVGEEPKARGAPRQIRVQRHLVRFLEGRSAGSH